MFKTTWCGGDTAPPICHNKKINVTATMRQVGNLPSQYDANAHCPVMGKLKNIYRRANIKYGQP